MDRKLGGVYVSLFFTAEFCDDLNILFFVDFRQCKSCISEKGNSVVFHCDKLSTVSGYR